MAAIIVTGAAGGLGPTLVRSLVARGDRVAAIGSARSLSRVQALEKELGSACVSFGFDVTSSSQWKEAMPEIEKSVGPAWGAALLAGGWEGGKRFYELDDEAWQHRWQQMLRINLETAQQSLRAILPGMIERRAGSVVVVGSRVVERPWTGVASTAYTVAKSAVVALARAVAAEVLQSSVRVNAVLPGTIDTEANRASAPKGPTHWVSTESLSKVIGFLLSDAARDISGSAIPVYGES